MKLLDMREIALRQHHELIDEAFVLTNDHDPTPFYYQLDTEHLGQFT